MAVCARRPDDPEAKLCGFFRSCPNGCPCGKEVREELEAQGRPVEEQIETSRPREDF